MLRNPSVTLWKVHAVQTMTLQFLDTKEQLRETCSIWPLDNTKVRIIYLRCQSVLELTMFWDKEYTLIGRHRKKCLGFKVEEKEWMAQTSER